MAIDVAVIDDSSVVIQGVIEVLHRHDGFAFAGDLTAVGPDAPSPTVLVMDPFAGPAVTLETLAALPASLAVLVMSASVHPGQVRQALHAGARGYLGKETDVPTLLAAIAAVGSGNLYLGGGISAALIHEWDEEPTDGPRATSGLTPRERDVLVLVARGFTHKQIGTRLSLSKSTVDTYVHRVRQKVGTTNKAGLTRVAIDLNLLSDG